MLLFLVKMFSYLTTFAKCDGKISCKILLHLPFPELLLTGTLGSVLSFFSSLVVASTRFIGQRAEGNTRGIKYLSFYWEAHNPVE